MTTETYSLEWLIAHVMGIDLGVGQLDHADAAKVVCLLLPYMKPR